MFDVGDPEMPEGKRASPAHLVLDPPVQEVPRCPSV